MATRHRSVLHATLAVVVLAAGLGAGLPGATAQAPNLECLNCAVELRVLEWNGTGAPGSFVTGTFRVENTGESSDSYAITVNTSEDTWVADVESDNTGDLAPGSGLLADPSSNSFDFQVIVLVPETATAGAESGITVTAQSDNDAAVSDEAAAIATATQVYGWSLACTPSVEIQKTEEGGITLEATNEGNGPDSATIAVIGVNGLAISDPRSVTASAGGNDTQDLDVGVGLSLEDGDYAIRWNLTSTKSPSTSTTCTTTITVTGGAAPPGTEDDGESEDSPALAPLPAVVALLALVLHRRRRHIARA